MGASWKAGAGAGGARVHLFDTRPGRVIGLKELPAAAGRKATTVIASAWLPACLTPAILITMARA